MIAKEIRIKVTVSIENVQAVIDEYKAFTGKEPSERWILAFLRADASSYYYGDTFTDGLGDAVANSIE